MPFGVLPGPIPRESTAKQTMSCRINFMVVNFKKKNTEEVITCKIL